MKGKRPRWFSWLEREFPYYEKIQQCDKGYKINGHSRLSRVNLIWSEEGLAGGTSDYEAHCDWLEEQSAEPDSRISFQAYNSDALAKFIDSCGRFLDDPTFKADIARAEATRRNLQLACRIRNITEQDDEYIFPAGSNGLTLAPLAMFRHVERDSAYGRTYHGGVNLQSA